jgi:hypothetical protein
MAGNLKGKQEKCQGMGRRLLNNESSKYIKYIENYIPVMITKEYNTTCTMGRKADQN